MVYLSGIYKIQVESSNIKASLVYCQLRNLLHILILGTIGLC